MKKNRLLKAVLSALAGHMVGLLFLFIMSFVAIKLDTPTSVGDGFAFIAVALGAIACGLVSKKISPDTISALFSGAIFAGAPLAVSLTSASSSRPILVRVGLCILMLLAVFVASGASRGKSIKKRKSSAARRRAIYKNA